MRFALPILVTLAAVGLAGCGGDDETTAAPLPIAQRFVTAEDAPGSKPDPVEKRQTTTDYASFTSALSDSSIDADTDEMAEVFESADFKSAGVDARYFGETHSPETSVHVFSSFIEQGSEDAATSAPRLARDGSDEAMPDDLCRAEKQLRGERYSRRTGRPPRRNR